MKYVLLTISALGIAFSIYSSAFAGQNCTTTCRDGYGGQRTCNTHCW